MTEETDSESVMGVALLGWCVFQQNPTINVMGTILTLYHVEQIDTMTEKAPVINSCPHLLVAVSC